MVARIQTVAFQVIDTLHIDVQAHTANSLPSFTIVGPPDNAVGKKQERVGAALGAHSLTLPPQR